jgi:ribosome-binding factor A
MKKQRIERINSLLKEVLFEVIQKEVRNPAITTFVTVTRVVTTSDLHHATVFVSLIATPAEKEKIVEALQSAAGFIAIHASKKVKLRYFPQLVFKIDTGVDEHMRIEELLHKIEEERRLRENES